MAAIADSVEVLRGVRSSEGMVSDVAVAPRACRVCAIALRDEVTVGDANLLACNRAPEGELHVDCSVRDCVGSSGTSGEKSRAVPRNFGEGETLKVWQSVKLGGRGEDGSGRFSGSESGRRTAAGLRHVGRSASVVKSTLPRGESVTPCRDVDVNASALLPGGGDGTRERFPVSTSNG